MQDSYRLRFLRARKYNLDTAATMLRAHVEYKEKARPDEFIIELGTVRLNEHSEPLPDSAQMSEMALSGSTLSLLHSKFLGPTHCVAVGTSHIHSGERCRL